MGRVFFFGFNITVEGYASAKGVITVDGLLTTSTEKTELFANVF